MLCLKVLPASRQVLQQQMVPAAFAAQSLLAALGSVQFVSNVFFAYFVLHEKVSIGLSTAACCHTVVLSYSDLMYHCAMPEAAPNCQHHVSPLMQSNKRVVLATALIVCGCIVLVTFGNHHSKALTAKQLQQYYRR